MRNIINKINKSEEYPRLAGYEFQELKEFIQCLPPLKKKKKWTYTIAYYYEIWEHWKQREKSTSSRKKKKIKLYMQRTRNQNGVQFF